MEHEPTMEDGAPITFSIWITGVCVFVRHDAELHVVMPKVTGTGSSAGIPPHKVVVRVGREYVRADSQIPAGETAVHGHSIEVPSFVGSPLRPDLPPETVDLSRVYPGRRVMRSLLEHPFPRVDGHVVLRSGEHACYHVGGPWRLAEDPAERMLPFRVEWSMRIPAHSFPEVRLRPFATGRPERLLRLQPSGGRIVMGIGHVPLKEDPHHKHPHLRALAAALEPPVAARDPELVGPGIAQSSCGELVPMGELPWNRGDLFTCMFGEAELG